MEKFDKHSGVAAPLNMINIDTDKLIPKQFLKTIKRTGLGKSLFFEMRYGDDGKEINVQAELEHIFKHYEQEISNVDFRLDTERVKRDIKKRTALFMKKRR